MHYRVDSAVNNDNVCAIFVRFFNKKVKYIYVDKQLPHIVIGFDDDKNIYEINEHVASTLRIYGKILVVECRINDHNGKRNVNTVRETLYEGVKQHRGKFSDTGNADT